MSTPFATATADQNSGSFDGVAAPSDADEIIDESAHLMGLVSLTGARILNYDQEILGTVADLMFDLDSGRVSYAVMASGGFLGLGEKHFAIPWGVLEIDRDRKCLVLDADAATFQKSPGFNPGRWSESQPGDSSWQDKLHLHYRSKS
ncbi:hypothetical protein BH09PSE5_BH09PSE5_19200 [soil metagenome]